MKTHRKIRAFLAANGFMEAEFTPKQISYLQKNGIMMPLAGADGEDENEDEDEDNDEDEESDEDEDEETKAKSKSKSKSKSKEDGDDEDDDDDADVVKMSRSEAQRLRRVAKEAEEAKKKTDSEKKAAERKKAAEEGRYNDMIKDAETERDEALKERDDAKAELLTFKREVVVTRIASQLGFRDPTDAMKYISEEDADDEKVAERALTNVLKKKPYLKSDKVPTGTKLNGGGKGGLTAEDIAKMSEEEVNARWDEVQKVLQANGS